MMKPATYLVIGGAMLLAACTANGDVPTTRASHAPDPPASADPSPSATTSLDPTVDPTSLPSLSGWSPRSQTVGEGTEPDTPWATERDVDEVLEIWASYACVEASHLPRPARVLEGAFADVDGRPAVVERLEFDEGGDVGRAFTVAYADASVACGTATRIGDHGLRREIQGSVWSEVLLADESGVTMAVIQADLDEDAAEALLAQLN